ncbi:MAG: prolyl oligopeptidase family serine peptidase [Ardenticatenales bacterium]
MPRDPMTVDRLWSLPRVGAPSPLPDGTACIVPVTTYDMTANTGSTRLWRVAVTGTADALVRPMTSADVSSSQPAVSPDGSRLVFARKPGSSASKAAKSTTAATAATGKAAGTRTDGAEDSSTSTPPSTPAPTGRADGPARFGEVDQLWLMPLDGGEAVRLTDLPLGAQTPVWFPDGRRIAFVSPVYSQAPTLAGTAERHKAREDDAVKAYVTEDRVYRYWDRWLTDGIVQHVFVLDVEAGTLADVTPSLQRWLYMMPPGNGVSVSPDGRTIAFDACRADPPYDRLLWGAFAVDVPADLAAAAADPAPLAPPRLIAPDGAVLGGADGDAKTSATAPDDQREAHRPVFSPDGRWLVYGLQREFDFYADRMRLVAIDRTTNAHTVLTEGWDASPGEWTFDPDAPATLWFTAEIGPRNAVWTLDIPAAVAAAAADPSGATPTLRACDGTLSSPKPAGGRVFCAHASLTEPPSAAWFAGGAVSLASRYGDAGGDTVGDASTVHRIGRFTDAAMADLALGPVEDVTFAGADGDAVQMFVVYPPGATIPAAGERPAQPWPLVHMIHGGPHGTLGDGWQWRWCAHAFAAPGYVVALVNFHGSTGFGEAFTKSILGRWGDQPSRDVEAATDVLIERGIADPARMAITGGSYGGYLVSWLCGTTDRYTCAVNHAGVSDFQTQFASDVTQGRARSMGGELWENVAGLDRWNPLRQAAGFKTPMLVVHGQRDYRVPYNQGLEIYNVYRARGLPSRLVVYPDENHWVLKPQNSVHWYGEVLGWLGRWLGPAAIALLLATMLAASVAACGPNDGGATGGAAGSASGASSIAEATSPSAADHAATTAPGAGEDAAAAPIAPDTPLTDAERASLTALQGTMASAHKASDEQLATLRALHAAHPSSADVSSVLQAALVAREDWTGLAAVLTARPSLTAPERATLAKVYIKLGRWADAAAIARPLSDAAPTDPDAAYAAALPLARLGQLDDAAAVLDRAHDAIVNARSADALTLRGMIHLDAREADQAAAVLEQAAALNPDYFPAYNALGRARMALGDDAGAKAAYDQVAAIHTRDDAVTAQRLRLSARATALKAAWDAGDYATARTTIEAMLPEADAADASTRRDLWQFAAAIYEALGEDDKAAAAQAEAGKVEAAAP